MGANVMTMAVRIAPDHLDSGLYPREPQAWDRIRTYATAPYGFPGIFRLGHGLANVGIAMLTHKLPRTNESQSLARGSPYVVGAGSVIIALLSMLIGLEISVATAWSDAAPAAGMTNRSGKGDRLPLAFSFHWNAVSEPMNIDVLRTPAADQELFDGCEALASSLVDSPLGQIAVRCVS